MPSSEMGKRFREISDRHREETGETLFAGSDSPNGTTVRGYYFSFGYFPADMAGRAMEELMKRRDAVPHVLATGMDNGVPFTWRQCPANYCIGSPHPKGTLHHDNTGATWHTRDNGEAYDIQGHDGE